MQLAPHEFTVLKGFSLPIFSHFIHLEESDYLIDKEYDRQEGSAHLMTDGGRETFALLSLDMHLLTNEMV